MNRRFDFCLLSTGLSFLLAIVLMSNLGCKGPTLPEQEVPTLWQKLGIPQAYVRARDNLVNAKGNHPLLEAKPPLKKLADPSLLKLEMPGVEPIKVAAEIKMQEDLAEQKIKAIKYLGLIGCDCYDDEKKIQKALLEALKDCSPCVRLAAIEAVRTTVDECNRRAQRFDRQRQNCGRDERRGKQNCGCGGRGCKLCSRFASCGTPGCTDCGQGVCSQCGGYGCEFCAQPICGQCGGYGCQACAKHGCRLCGGRGCTACVTVAACDQCGDSCGGTCNAKNCCSKEIQEQLKKLAFGKDDDGCWFEPVEKIRSAAASLLQQCPPIVEPPKVEPPIPPEVEGTETEGTETEGATEEEKKKKEQSGQATTDTSTFHYYNEPPIAGTNMTIGDQADVPVTSSRRAQIQSPAMTQTVSQPINTPSAARDPNMIRGRIGRIDGTLFYIALNGSFVLPQGAVIVAQTETGMEREMVIVSSGVAQIVAEPTNSWTGAAWNRGMTVNIGIVGQ